MSVEGEVGMCSFCGEIASQKCASCKIVFYCKRDCQKADWKKGHKEECNRAVRIEQNSVLGRYVIVTKDFKAGEIIFKEEPLVVGPKQITEPVCLACYKRVYGSYRCSKCSWPMCSVECEKGADHQPECIVGQEIGSPIEISNFNLTNHFYEVILPLRCLTLKKRSPRKYDKILKLESHEEERKGSETYKENQSKIVNMLRNYFMLLSFPVDEIDSSETMIHRINGILDTNAVDIDLRGNEFRGLYDLFSMLENSCIPNVRYYFNINGDMIVKAATDIKKGEHLSTMYTHILWSTLARRENLKLNKYFLCTCTRCADSTELGSNFSTLRCQECKAGYVTSAAPLDELADWICSNCNVTIPVTKVKEITLDLGEEVDKCIASPSLRVLEALLETKASTIVHPNHFHLFAVKHTLLQLYGREGGINEETMNKKESLCKSFLYTCTALDPGMSRLAPYASVALYEYHVAIMSRTRQPDGSTPTPQSIKKDVEIAKALLNQCISMLADETEESPGQKLREIAKVNLRELEELGTNMP